MPNACSLAPPKKAQLRAPLSPLQTAWTGFDPNLYSDGSSSAGPALVEIATATALCLYSQSPQACKPFRRAPTWLTTALLEWNALLTILAPGVWQTLR